MEKSLSKSTVKISTEAAFIFLTVVCAVVLPQIFHGVGVLLGVGGKLGQIFLPMYIPVLIIGFYRGPVSGAIAGLLSPIASFLITDMPSAEMLPFITLELIVMGLLSGVFSKSKLHATLRVLLVQVIAKISRLIVFAISLGITTGGVSAGALFNGILISIPGVIIQLALLTYLIIEKEKPHE